MLDDIAKAVAQFAVVHRLSHIDLRPRGVRHDPDHQWNHNLREKQAEITGQGHHQEARMEGKAWSHMEMVLPIQAQGELHGPERLVKPITPLIR